MESPQHFAAYTNSVLPCISVTFVKVEWVLNYYKASWKKAIYVCEAFKIHRINHKINGNDYILQSY